MWAMPFAAADAGRLLSYALGMGCSSLGFLRISCPHPVHRGLFTASALQRDHAASQSKNTFWGIDAFGRANLARAADVDLANLGNVKRDDGRPSALSATLFLFWGAQGAKPFICVPAVSARGRADVATKAGPVAAVGLPRTVAVCSLISAGQGVKNCAGRLSRKACRR